MTTINPYAKYTDPKQLPQPHTPPIISAIYKATPADFIVEEILNIEFNNQQDQCEHLWLHIKKIGINSTHIANELAKWAKIPSRDVGYSGLKDRHAVTSQWFSLRLPTGTPPISPFIINDKEKSEYAEVLEQHWHNKKLGRGTHQHNRFIIRLREVIGHKNDIEQTLALIAKQGVPNYFGEQRFGREGGNIATALEWFEKDSINGKPVPTEKSGKLNKQDKRKNRKHQELQSILLSSARSAIFNQILAQRVRDGSWNRGTDGEVFNLANTGSVFASEKMDDGLIERISSHDIHPTGAMWGIQTNDKAQVTSTALQIETDVVQSSQVLQRLATGLENKGLKPARRPLRLLVTNMSWQWRDDKTLVLDFQLPAGSFATSVLAGLICLV